MDFRFESTSIGWDHGDCIVHGDVVCMGAGDRRLPLPIGLETVFLYRDYLARKDWPGRTSCRTIALACPARLAGLFAPPEALGYTDRAVFAGVSHAR
jgi:hypothetical protein